MLSAVAHLQKACLLCSLVLAEHRFYKADLIKALWGTTLVSLSRADLDSVSPPASARCLSAGTQAASVARVSSSLLRSLWLPTSPTGLIALL